MTAVATISICRLSKSDALVELARAGLARSAFRQADLRRAALLQHIDGSPALGVRDRERGEQHDGIALGQHPQPLASPVAEERMTTHEARFIKDGQALLDSTEEIGENGDEIALANIM